MGGLYDWANSAFALSVLAVLFPMVSCRSYWSAERLPASAVTARLGWITFAGCEFRGRGRRTGIRDDRRQGRLPKTLPHRSWRLSARAANDGGPRVLVGQGRLADGRCCRVPRSLPSASTPFDACSTIPCSIDVTETPRTWSFVSIARLRTRATSAVRALLGIHVWMLMAPATFGIADASAAKYSDFRIRDRRHLVGSFSLLPLVFFVPERRGVALSQVPAT